MSRDARTERRAIARLEATGAVLLPIDAGGEAFGVFPKGDRRRRPLARLEAEAVRRLCSDGALEPADGGGFALSAAGRRRVRREAAAPAEAFQAQHQVRGARAVADPHGAAAVRRANLGESALDWLMRRAGPAGERFLSSSEYAAGRRFQDDCELAGRDGPATSDWLRAPGGRGAGPAEPGLAPARRARVRIAGAMDALGPDLADVIRRACLTQDGLEAIERDKGWPRRSGKVALKLALARLAQFYSCAPAA